MELSYLDPEIVRVAKGYPPKRLLKDHYEYRCKECNEEVSHCYECGKKIVNYSEIICLDMSEFERQYYHFCTNSCMIEYIKKLSKKTIIEKIFVKAIEDKPQRLMALFPRVPNPGIKENYNKEA